MPDLCNDAIITKWMDTLNPPDNIKKIYLQGMQEFTDWINKSPDKLLVEAEDEIKSGLLMRRRKIKSYLICFRKYLQDQGLSDNTIKSRLAGVKSFYKLFDIEIPAFLWPGNKARTLEENNDTLTKEHL